MNKLEVYSGFSNEAIKSEVMKRWSDHGVEPELEKWCTDHAVGLQANSPASYLNPDAAEFTPAMRALEKEPVLLTGDFSSKEKEDNTNTQFTDQVTLPCRYTCKILSFILKHFVTVGMVGLVGIKFVFW